MISASRSFCDVFKVKPEETLGRLIYNLGDKHWGIAELRQLLETCLPQKFSLDDYELKHEFADLGSRTMLFNAREIPRKPGKKRIILLVAGGMVFRKSTGYAGGKESNQSVKTEASYLQNRLSRVMMHSFSSRAWAIIILSKGSRWCIGSPPAAYA